MRLLHVHSLELEQFHSASIPKYVIASHRWNARDEATYDDIRKRRNTDRIGYKKVEAFAGYIREHIPSVEWLWIDTCCIDLRNHVELSEAINVMFEWYRNAELCIVYLADVEAAEDVPDFMRSDWFTRGWNLLELLAPRTVVFLTKTWHVIGSKGDIEYNRCHDSHIGPSLNRTIAAITGIPEEVLVRYENSNSFSIEEKLQWTVGRRTTREEDIVYCMFGIIGVHLPVIYGEGKENARTRLYAAIEQKQQREKSSRSPQYLPLADARSETRILNILNTEELDGPVRCSLAHIPLHDSPEYVALSYHWGDSKVTSPILVSTTGEAGGAIKVPVTASLEACLRELRRRRAFSVWVDVLCINQQDISERNQQVSIMGKIYGSATKVVGWVGLPCVGSGAAIRAMLPKDHQSSTTENRASNKGSPILDVYNLRVFLGRPYFSRMWIIQELAKARVAELWCGQDTVRLEDFNEFVLNSQIAKSKLRQKSLFDAIRLFHGRERQSKIGVPRMLLSQALVASRCSVASDPRDNIYAILGLTLDGEDVVTIPDYRRSVDDVFAAASKYMIASQGQVSLIVLARGSDNASTTPSWMPDWSERTPLPPWIKECVCRERDTLDFSSRASHNTLSVLGYFLDDVWEDTPQEDQLDANENMRVTVQMRNLTMQDWSEKFMEDPVHFQAAQRRNEKLAAAGMIASLQSESTVRETKLLALESGVRDMARFSMRLVRLRRRGFRIMHLDAEHRDQVWRLENCPLPVVLRPLPNGRFSFIGEVYADVRESKWWELIWEDFSTGGPIDIHHVRPQGVTFHQKESKTVCIE